MTVRPSPQADRVVEVLSTLAIAGPLSLSEIARRTNVNKSSMYSMLLALTKSGWLLRHPDLKTFHLGPELAALGRIAGDQLPVLELARPVMLDLVDRLGVSCRAYRRFGTVSVLVDAIIRDGSVALSRGQQFPIHPPFGIIFVAWDQPADVESWLTSGNGDPAASIQPLRELVAGVRERGYLLRASREDSPHSDRLIEQVNRSLDVSPARRWDLLELLALVRNSRIKEAVDGPLEPDFNYYVSGIDVAVRDSSGQAVLALQFGPFPTPVPPTTIEGHAQIILAAIAPINAALGFRTDSTPFQPQREAHQ